MCWREPPAYTPFIPELGWLATYMATLTATRLPCNPQI